MILTNMIKRADATLSKDNVYGNYDPSEAATILFMVLFFLATLLTLSQIIKNKKDTPNPIGVTVLFMGPPILEFVGFSLRIPSVLSPSNPGLYLANMIILGLGPLYLTAINLFTFSALVAHAGVRYSVCRPWLITFQSIIFLIQCIHLQTRGVAQAYNYTMSLDYRNAGSIVMLIGLGVNLAMWIIYAILFAIFVMRYFREHSISSTNPITKRVRSISIALGINILTFLIRTTYRTVEFSLLLRSGEEVDDLWIYVWDATPTFIGIMALAILLPYDLPYGNTFRLLFRFGKCTSGQTDTERKAACEAMKSGKGKLDDETNLSKVAPLKFR